MLARRNGALESLTLQKQLLKGLRLRNPSDSENLGYSKKTKGGGLAVTEEEILKATLELSKKGFFVEPTCASAAVGLEKLRQRI